MRAWLPLLTLAVSFGTASFVSVSLAHAQDEAAEDAAGATGLLGRFSTIHDAVAVTGFVALEGRLFPNPEPYERTGQEQGSSLSLVIEPEFYWESEDRYHQVVFRPFARLDSNDSERTHYDIRDLYYLYLGDDVEFLIGSSVVFWGRTEVDNIVDIINQDDLVENIDGEDKLGQPMLQLALFRDFGTLRGYVLPGFRQRTFPGADGRLRPEFVVETDNPRYERGVAEGSVDFALRYENVLGPVDLGISHFHGTAREPVLEPDVRPDGRIRLRPYYEVIHQSGIDLSAQLDSWQLKFEGIYRIGQGDSFPAFVSGFEYTFFNLGTSGYDIGLLSEYAFDARDEVEAPPTLLNNDLFVGTRLTLNDIQDTELLAGALVDLEDGSTSLSAEFERRIGDRYLLEIEARSFIVDNEDNVLYPTRNDDHVIVRLSRYF